MQAEWITGAHVATSMSPPCSKQSQMFSGQFVGHTYPAFSVEFCRRRRACSPRCVITRRPREVNAAIRGASGRSMGMTEEEEEEDVTHRPPTEEVTSAAQVLPGPQRKTPTSAFVPIPPPCCSRRRSHSSPPSSSAASRIDRGARERDVAMYSSSSPPPSTASSSFAAAAPPSAETTSRPHALVMAAMVAHGRMLSFERNADPKEQARWK